MSEEQQSAEPVMQWVTFVLEGEKYGVNVMQVQEVLRVSEIAPVPGAPDYVVGIINLRGNVVTVIDTRGKFGLFTKETDDNSRIIITESKGEVFGILVDRVSDVVDLFPSDIDSAPNVGNEESSKYIQGVSSKDGKILILVDLNRFVNGEELEEIEMF